MTRDRLANPSSNFPESQEEANLAIKREVEKWLEEVTSMLRPATVWTPFYARTTEVGFGNDRTQEQADWLNNAVNGYLARLDTLKRAIKEQA